MHHPIQMKPADSEKNNGKDFLAFPSVFFCALILSDNSDVHFLSNDNYELNNFKNNMPMQSDLVKHLNDIINGNVY